MLHVRICAGGVKKLTSLPRPVEEFEKHQKASQEARAQKRNTNKTAMEKSDRCKSKATSLYCIIPVDKMHTILETGLQPSNGDEIVLYDNRMDAMHSLPSSQRGSNFALFKVNTQVSEENMHLELVKIKKYIIRNQNISPDKVDMVDCFRVT